MTTVVFRVDCEHVEADRWAGDASLEVRAVPKLLEQLGRIDVRATWAFVGLTAREHPDLVRAALAAGHNIAGHSMRHAGPYRGKTIEWQREDLRGMVDAISDAAGRPPNGLAAPSDGLIDQNTLFAAADVGLNYVHNATIRAAGEGYGAASGGPPSVLVPPAAMPIIWDWTDRFPDCPPFSPAVARQRWEAALEQVGPTGMVSFNVHPWVVELNDEYAFVTGWLTELRERGITIATLAEVTRLS